MIQIRKKKEIQRQEIRRDFLDNYFREMRKNCFNFRNNNQRSDLVGQQINLFEFMLQESLQKNHLAQRIREFGLLEQLQNLIEQNIKSQNLFEVKFLLTIISNAFKDDLEVDEQIALYRLSATLFQSLQISHIDLTKKPHRDHFEKVTKTLHPETLVFYMLSAKQISPYLDEQEQIKIQQQIYPAFVNVFIFTLSHSQEITNLDNFRDDIGSFFKNIFDQNDSFYEMSNKMKAQRLLPFYENVFEGHLWLLKNMQEFGNIFEQTQVIIFKSYLKLTQILGDLPQFLKGEKIFRIIDFTLRKSSRKQEESKLIFVFSILEILLDKNIQYQYAKAALQTRDDETNIMAFERAIKLVMENSIVRFRALEMIEGVMILLFQENLFRELVQTYEIELVDMCTQVLGRFQRQMMGVSKDRKMVLRAISILRIFVEKQNIEGRNNGSLIKRFESQQGAKFLEQVQAYLRDADIGDDAQIIQSLEHIETILQVINIDIDFQTMTI